MKKQSPLHIRLRNGKEIVAKPEKILNNKFIWAFWGNASDDAPANIQMKEVVWNCAKTYDDAVEQQAIHARRYGSKVNGYSIVSVENARKQQNMVM